MVEKVFRGSPEQVPTKDSILIVAADKTLSIYENIVHVDSSNAATTITLPQVSEAVGRVFLIVGESGGSNDVTVQVNSSDSSILADSGAAVTSYTFDTDNDHVALISTGRHWIELSHNSA